MTATVEEVTVTALALALALGQDRARGARRAFGTRRVPPPSMCALALPSPA